MINLIKYYIKKIFFRIYFYFNVKKYYVESYDFNFQNIVFLDKKYLKIIFLSNKFLTEKDLYKINLNYHSFDWLYIAKNMGGAENVTRARNHILNWYENEYQKVLYKWQNILFC